VPNAALRDGSQDGAKPTDHRLLIAFKVRQSSAVGVLGGRSDNPAKA